MEGVWVMDTGISLVDSKDAICNGLRLIEVLNGPFQGQKYGLRAESSVSSVYATFAQWRRVIKVLVLITMYVTVD